MIQSFRLFRYLLPLRADAPGALAALGEREGLLLRIENAEGQVGWGEVAPLPGFSRELWERVARESENIAAARDEWPRLGTGPAHLSQISPSVRFGLDCALASLAAAERGCRLREIWHETSAGRVAVNRLVCDEPETALSEAAAAAGAGYRAVKLKVGKRPVAEDVALVQSVREAIGPDVDLRLDANRAWSLDEACTFLRAIRDLPYAYVEEPLRVPTELESLPDDCGARIALDETLLKSSELKYPIALDSVVALVLKPTLLGGIEATRRWQEVAVNRGLEVVVSSSIESAVGLSALAHLAAGEGWTRTAAGLDTQALFTKDIVDAQLVDAAGCIDVEQSGPLAPIEDRLEELEVNASMARSLGRLAGPQQMN